MTLESFFTSLLRTYVPIIWGVVVSGLIQQAPALEPFQDTLVGYGDTFAIVAGGVLAGAVTTAWYGGWRWLEPRLPDWATTIVLGSAKRPVYAMPPAVDAEPTLEPANEDGLGL